MKQRWPILLMLLIVVLQGGGLLRAVHLFLEHSPVAERTDAGAEKSLQGSDKPHQSHHHHDPANCPICQSLASLKAMSSNQGELLIVWQSPVFQCSTYQSVLKSSTNISNLSPRAPPA